ncbi:MAG: helix-turn-helix domain-containing protein [Rhodopirellula sp.]|nr:helix-turn-helix domain-containing protein [Rhodopirellula sp.]
MAKKYLSLQEAADLLGVSEERLKQARADGDIRGFADRGNWKFRQEDIDEFGRTQQLDSNPEVPLMIVDDSNVLEDDDVISEQPTIIRKHDDDSNIFSEDDLGEGTSDSGVRLVLDSKLISSPLADSGADILSDSSVDIPLSLGDSDDEIALNVDDSSDEISVEIPVSLSDSSQESGLVLDDDDDEDVMDLGRSDSDVRLSIDLDDDGLLADSGSAIILGRDDSDSDVRLLDQTQPMILNDGPHLGLGQASDSDVTMVNTGSDSDVKLPSDSEGLSADDLSLDSDVRLIKTDSDSDVRLQTSSSDSDVRLLSPAPDLELNSDSDVSLIDHTDGGIELGGDDSDDDILLGDDDSGIALDVGADSDISLDLADDSGIALDIADDSGIALDLADDSGIALDVGTDSDISLAADVDSGLSLDIGTDSGIALDSPTDSGISLDGSDLAATAPAMKRGRSSNESTADTMVQMSAFDGVDDDDESDFELGALEGDSSSDTSVLLFDDEDDDADDRAATMIKKKGADSEETFDLDAGEVFDEEFEEDELLGEDDEIEDFADDEEFMADEDDFDEEFVSEDGAAGFVAPAAVGGVMRAPVEQDWGMGVFACVLITTILMLVCSGVTFDLVRYVWQAGEYSAVAGPMVDMMGIK